MDRFRITIASLPDRERLVAEICYDHVQWAEISNEVEGEPLMVEFYAHPREKCWTFPIDDALAILQKAKQRLESM